MSTLIARIASDEILETAMTWLCQTRKHYHFNGDVWQIRRWWHEKKTELQKLLLSGQYRFMELKLINGKERIIEWWHSQDALVLKAISLVLQQHLSPHLSRRCFHLAGTGGMKAAVREVAINLSKNTFVFRTDVKRYYASINHDILLRLLKQYVDDDKVLRLVKLYLKRFVSKDGLYVDIHQGISLGCSLSPLMGALYLKPLDDAMAKLGLFYVRYMDDWVICTPTRWKLRKAIKEVNRVLDELKVEKHPDKTFIGRITRGFDFLGYWFTPWGLAIAQKSIERMRERISRLQELCASSDRIEKYFFRWLRWFQSGLIQSKCCPLNLGTFRNFCPRFAGYLFPLPSLLASLWPLGSGFPYP